MKTRVEGVTLTPTELPARWSVPGAWLSALAVYLLAIRSGLVSERAAAWITDFAWTAAALIGALASRRAAQRVQGRARTAWYFLTAACASWLIGQLIWDWNQLIRGVRLPFPSTADAFYIGFALLVIAAMFAMRERDSPRAPTLRHLGNLALIGCSFAAAYAAAILEPALYTNRSPWFLTVALAESVTTTAAFVVAVYFLWSYRWGQLSTPLILIVAGIGLHAAANVLYIRALIVEEFGPTSLLSAAWIVAFGLQHWAAAEQVRVTRGTDAAATTIQDAERWIEAVLPAFLLLLIVLALYSLRAQLSARALALNALILGAFAVMLGAREVWLYVEERRLQRELDRARDDLQLTLSELRDSEGRYRALAGELEQRVALRTEQLQDAYRELESFAYAVSHDLKAPLRAMDGFSHLLLESSHEKLNQTELAHVQRIRRSAMQMDALIDGLLAYSRMERREMHAAPVDLPALVESLLAERETEIRERSMEVHIRIPPLTLTVDREGLSVVLRNLLENAFKFTHEGTHRDIGNVDRVGNIDRPTAPAIEIGAESSPGKTLIWVKDNGIGFDERYHDQIFLIFQRLHRAAQYRGTGIGLALARKAAQRMNGRLWARSAPGEGATFFLELPA